MPYIDNIIGFIQRENAGAIEIEPDQPCVLHAGGQTRPSAQKLGEAQIRGILGEIIPEDAKARLAAGAPVQFDYASPAGPVTVQAAQAGGSLRMKISLSGDAAPAPAEAPEPAAQPDQPPPAARPSAGPAKVLEHIDELLIHLARVEGSDIHVSSGNPPLMRLHGRMMEVPEFRLDGPEHAKKLLFAIAPTRNQEEWERDHDTDFAYHIPEVGRYRCNYCLDRYGIRAVFRLIPEDIVPSQKLGLPDSVLDLCFLSKGLVLVTGPTGTGKSTTLASLIDHVNRNREDHIITIEDPIEFVHKNIGCLVNQREVHTHTQSFGRALRAALREDPDIVLVGEMRDLETVAIAIETAETGHLVFGTLHTTTAPSTVDRVIDQFPAEQQSQIRVMLSESLKAVIAQTLCRTTDGRRAAAFEILLIDSAAANLIREGKTYQLHSVMQIGRARGCVTMNDSLLAHVKAGRVEPKEAYFKAVDKTSLLALFEAENIKFDPAAMR